MTSMCVHIDWQQQGSSTIVLDDGILRRAAEEGVNLDDQCDLGDFIAKRLKGNPSWFHDVVEDADERDAPELINGLMAEGDPPQWWIDAHTEPGDEQHAGGAA